MYYYLHIVLGDKFFIYISFCKKYVLFLKQRYFAKKFNKSSFINDISTFFEIKYFLA